MKKDNKLEAEEKNLLSSFEKNEWKTVKDIEKEKSQARKIASITLKKLINKPLG